MRLKSPFFALIIFILFLISCSPSAPEQTTSTQPKTTMEPTAGPTTSPTGIPKIEVTITAEPTQPTTRQVLVDTDMAGDDWFAILYLLQRNDVQVSAITVTGTGEAHCDPGVQNAVNLVALAGNSPIPVDCGAEVPLAGKNTFPDDWRSWVDGMMGIQIPPGSNPNNEDGAVELMISVLENSAKPVDLLTLGPLTNVANLIMSRPDLKANIRKIIIMGGAVNVTGNLGENVPGNSKAEWNIYVDPLAANIVFDSGIPVLLVGLDATNQVQLNRDFYNRFVAEAATAESDFVIEVLNKMQSFIDSGNWYFWDPMATAIMLDESLAEYKMHSLDVVEDKGSNQGAILINQDGPQVQVAITANGERFIDTFIETMNH